METGKVTVGILSYNHAAYLPATLDSVLSQTYRNLEIIIVDDGSTDESLEIAYEYKKKDERIKVFTHPEHKNLGISATCNLTVNKAKGEYINLLGSDDLYFPYTIDEQVKHLENHQELGMVCGIAQVINENGELTGTVYDENIWADSDYLETLIITNRVMAPTVMVRRKCYEQVGLYAEDLIYSDWEMWLRILLFSDWKIGYISKPLVYYRKHGSNISWNNSQKTDSERYLKVLQTIDKNIIEKNIKLDKSIRELINSRILFKLSDMFYLSAEEGNLKESINYLSEYYRHDPKGIIKFRRLGSFTYHLLLSLAKKTFWKNRVLER